MMDYFSLMMLAEKALSSRFFYSYSLRFFSSLSLVYF
jgi:hypothetical protein